MKGSGLGQTMWIVTRLTLESNFPTESLVFCIGSLWWRWGYITFDSSWTTFKQWVSLNNRRGLSSTEAPQLLFQLSESVLSRSSSSCTHWHELIPYCVIWPTHFPPNFHENSDKTKHLQLAVVEQLKSVGGLRRATCLMQGRTTAEHRKGRIKQGMSGKAIMYDGADVKKQNCCQDLLQSNFIM